ncbi:RcnB family protein [Pseudomonas koreensis]|uniref:RcnB family protein n=1 Tax=Pseudomonas koreensis TaxID=198620 RepID=UPI00320801FC
MNSKTLIASLALVAGIAGISPLVQAAQTSSDTVQHSPTGDRELKVGDRAPDVYQRNEKALKSWKQKGLKQPEDQSQWVQINDKYVLVKITNGTIMEITPVER